ncbi:hypothetical protein DFH08DRAFT_1000516 [Mycena albidolilacea]|uniref:Uncharacterized protein n=1 Tax=Mycena albidolilacea TaxID=1033008 RepID=A0AAD7A318_9AGAR|nr:hypothetical protein DFH08DRAFT_1000516 [Mycena albidolilacea]
MPVVRRRSVDGVVEGSKRGKGCVMIDRKQPGASESNLFGLITRTTMASPAADLLPTKTGLPPGGSRYENWSMTRYRPFAAAQILEVFDSGLLARILLRASFQPHRAISIRTVDVTTRSTYLRVPFVSVLNSKRLSRVAWPNGLRRLAEFEMAVAGGRSVACGVAWLALGYTMYPHLLANSPFSSLYQ